MAWDKKVTDEEDDLLLAYLYRGHVIRIKVEQDLGTLDWEAKGVIGPIEGGTSYIFNVGGASKPFRAEARR